MRKIYTKNNYLVIEFNGIKLMRPKKNIFFIRTPTENQYYLNDSEKNIPEQLQFSMWSDYVDFNDTAFGSLELFEVFITQNTGNFNTGPINGTIDPNDYDLAEFKNDSLNVFIQDDAFSNVDNTSDIDKPISTLTQNALNLKQNILSNTVNIKSIEGQSVLGSGNIDLTKNDIGLSNVDNTSDVNKPVSTATQTALIGKENSITIGTTAQYYRGDKSFQTLNKAAIGLSNVDNTTDLSKPISTLTQTALDAKQATLVSGTNIKTVNSNSMLGSGNMIMAVPALQFGSSYTKEWNGSITTATGTAVFDISSASFANIFCVTSICELSGATVVNAPIGCITSKSLTSVTISLFESKLTAVLLGGNIEGLETHAAANTIVYLTVKGN